MTGVRSTAEVAGNQRGLTWLLLACVVVAAPFYQIPGIPSFAISILHASLFLAFLIACAISLLSARRVALATDGASLALWVLPAAVASTLLMTSSLVSGASLFTRTYVLPVIFFLLAFNLLRSERDMIRVARLLVVAPAILAICIILPRFDFSAGLSALPALVRYSNELTGLSMSRGALAISLAFALPLLVAWLISSCRRATATWLVLLPVSVIAALALYTTWARSAIAVSVLAILGVLWSVSRKAAVAVVLVVLSVGLLVSPKIAAWMRAAGPVDILTSGRSYLVPAAATIIAEHPLVGVGLGNFSSHASALLPEQAKKYGTENPHNLPLYVAAESGILAGVACCLFVLGVSAMALRVLVRSRDPVASAFASVVLSGALLSLASAGVVFGNLLLNIPWWISLAALLRTQRAHCRTSRVEERDAGSACG